MLKISDIIIMNIKKAGVCMKKNKKKIIISLILFCISICIFAYGLIWGYKSPKVYSKNSDGSINLKYNDEANVSIDITEDNISGFIFYGSYIYSNIKLEVKVLDSNNGLVYHNLFTQINHKKNIIFFDKKLEKSTYTIQFKLLNDDGNINLKTISNDILIEQIGTKYNQMFMFLCGVLCLATFIFFCTSIISFKKNKKIKPIYNLFFYIIYFIICLFFANYLCLAFYTSALFDCISRNYIIVSFLLMLLIAIFGISKLKKDFRYENLFLILAIPIAICYGLFGMPEDSFDEYKHYSNAYSFAQNNFDVMGKNDVPNVIVADWKGLGTVKNMNNIINSPYNYDDTKSITSTSSNPVIYLLSSIGIKIGQLLNVHPYIGWYIAKFLNLIFYLTMGYFTIKLMPFFKLFSLFYLMIPINIYQVLSISGDSSTNIFSLFLIAYILNLTYSKNCVKFYDSIIIGISSYFTIAYRVSYLPMLLGLYFILIKKYNKFNIKNIILLIICILVPTLSYFLYQLYLSNNIIVTEIQFDLIVGNTSLIPFSITHFSSIIRVVINYLITGPTSYIDSFIGYEFEWGNWHVPSTYSTFYLLLLFASSFIRDDKINTKILEKFVLSISTLFVFILTVLGLYFYDYRSNILTEYLYGVQGRYFIPIFIFLFLCINKLPIEKYKEKYTYIMVSLCMVIQFLYIYYLIMNAIF